MRWDRLCRPKAYGGLSFKQLHNVNIAMLGKQGWQLLSKLHTLVSKIFKARYYPKSSFVEASLGSNPSYAWRSIIATQKVIIQGSCFQVGGGSTLLLVMFLGSLIRGMDLLRQN